MLGNREESPINAHNPAAFVAVFDNTDHVVLPFQDWVDLTVDWGDDTVEQVASNWPSHRYAHEGRWTVTASGRARTMSRCDKSVVEVMQWGRLGLTSARNAFSLCANLKSVPNNTHGLEAVTDMSRMFYRATLFNSPLDQWDMPAVADTSGMFFGATLFNSPLDQWDVRNVTDMSSMFEGAVSFDQPIENWDVSRVTDMSHMLSGARAFNQPLNGWDVSSVTDTASMFAGACRFNRPLDAWDMSNVTYMTGMFHYACRFFQDISGWTIRISHDQDERKFLKTFTAGTMLSGALLPACAPRPWR